MKNILIDNLFKLQKKKVVTGIIHLILQIITSIISNFNKNNINENFIKDITLINLNLKNNFQMIDFIKKIRNLFLLN